ncbi:MAG: hypothetical protein K6E41_05920, partial [Solobacterium sp.]|nr:hypothetical protein [Solobacterium sp.]
MIPVNAERQEPSAFVLSQEEIEQVLRCGSGFEGSKIRIAALYAQNPTPADARDFLKDEYGIGGHSHTYLDGSHGFVDYNGQGMRLSRRGFSEEMRLRWPAVEKHISRMMTNGTYLTEDEQERFTELQRTYAENELPLPIARMHYPPPLQDVPAEAVENRQTEKGTSGISEEADQPDSATDIVPDNPPLQPGEYEIPEHDGLPAMRETVIDLSLDAPMPPPSHPQPKAPPQPPFAYHLEPGDTIYLDNRPFTVDEVRFYDVAFRDPEMIYPIYRAESKTILEPLLDRDARNWPFRTEPLPAQAVTEQPAVNFHITDDHLGEGGPKTKYENNVRAIRTLKTLEKEHRPASPEDQEVLSQYVGWGGIPQAFDENNPTWADEYRELRYLLTDEEYDMARASTLNAHYTSPTVIKAIYAAVEQMGFRAGNILEPSCGVGNFFGLLPESM